jgi:hypothetical protein
MSSPLYGPEAVAAARKALRTHDALLAVYGREPENGDDGMPLDAAAWMAWGEFEYKPAFAEWKTAMRALEFCLHMDGMSHHPANFRPLCQSIIDTVAV